MRPPAKLDVVNLVDAAVAVNPSSLVDFRPSAEGGFGDRKVNKD